MGIGTLYRHFPDRDALLAGLVLQALRLVVDVLTAAAGGIYRAGLAPPAKGVPLVS